jgi:metal-responsive CopG/Arc/MetJ family transcriptional regulator
MTLENLQLVHVKLPADLYDRLESYWHDKRLPSRSEAIRQAIEEMVDRNARATKAGASSRQERKTR